MAHIQHDITHHLNVEQAASAVGLHPVAQEHVMMDTGNHPTESPQDEIARLRRRVVELKRAEARRRGEGRYRLAVNCGSPEHICGLCVLCD